MAAPTDIDLADAWSETLRRHARISCALERELQAEHGLGVSEFEVLEWLAMHGKDDCRMQELSEGVHLSQSALSRLLGPPRAGGPGRPPGAGRLGVPRARPGGPPRHLRLHQGGGPQPLRGGAPDAAGRARR